MNCQVRKRIGWCVLVGFTSLATIGALRAELSAPESHAGISMASLGFEKELPLFGTPLFSEEELRSAELDRHLTGLKDLVSRLKVLLAHGLYDQVVKDGLEALNSGQSDPAMRAEIRSIVALGHQLCGHFGGALRLEETTLREPIEGLSERALRECRERIEKLRQRSRLAEQVIGPIERKLVSEPTNAEAWAELATAWTDPLLFSPRNARLAAANALSLAPALAAAKRAEEWALAEYFLAVPGLRKGAISPETDLQFFFNPDLFAQDPRDRASARLEEAPLSSVAHWAQKIRGLKGLNPGLQYKYASEARPVAARELADDPGFGMVDAALATYLVRNVNEWRELQGRVANAARRELFSFELRYLRWTADNLERIAGSDTRIETAWSALAFGARNTTLKAGAARSHNEPIWAAVFTLADAASARGRRAQKQPELQRDTAEALERLFAYAGRDDEARLVLARFYHRLWRTGVDWGVTPGEVSVQAGFAARAKGLFQELEASSLLRSNDMLASASLHLDAGDAKTAARLMKQLTDNDETYGLTDLEQREYSAFAWLEAGLMHLAVASETEGSYEPAERCFDKAESLLSSDSPQQVLVEAAVSLLTRDRPPGPALSDPRWRSADPTLCIALQFRLARLAFVRTAAGFAGLEKPPMRSAWASPLYSPSGYKKRDQAIRTELHEGISRKYWEVNENDGARGVASGFVQLVAAADAGTTIAPKPGERVLGEARAFFESVDSLLIGLADGARGSIFRYDLTPTRFRDRVLPVLLAATSAESLKPPYLSQLRGAFEALESQLELRCVGNSHVQDSLQYFVEHDAAVKTLLARVNELGPVGESRASQSLQWYVAQEKVAAQNFERDQAFWKDIERLRADPSSKVIYVDGRAVLDFRTEEERLAEEEAKNPAPVLQTSQPTAQAPKTRWRWCLRCHATGTVRVTRGNVDRNGNSITEQANETCSSCLGTGKLPY